MNMTRRCFFTGAVAAAVLPRAAQAMMAAGGKDPNLSVFMSDIHVASGDIQSKWGPQPTYQNPCFKKAVDAVLAMRPLPARVVVFGDVALWHGHLKDYETSLPEFRRLNEAGIETFVTTGNHDHRAPMFKCHPRQAEITPVPGRVVSVIDLGTADLLLMDSLQENEAGEGSWNEVSGALDQKQQDWLKEWVKNAKRPFFIGAHHQPEEVLIGKDKIASAFANCPLFAGYIHGHNHRWRKNWYQDGTYSRTMVKRSVCLPSTGWWGDIGYAEMRTFADRAELKLVETDFYFPRPLNPGEKRPREWDEILSENRACAHMTFPF